MKFIKMQIIEKQIISELNSVIESRTVIVSVKDFFMEAGFKKNCTLQEKSKFYNGAAKLVTCVNMISDELNENMVYLGTFSMYEKNYLNWTDIKHYDAYNNLKNLLKSKESKAFNLSDVNIIDLAVECNLRYLSHIMIYFPKSKIFIRPDVHCYLEILGNSYILERIYTFLKEHNDGKYLIDYKDEIE